MGGGGGGGSRGMDTSVMDSPGYFDDGGASFMGGGGSLDGSLASNSVTSMTSALSNAEYFPCSASLSSENGGVITPTVEPTAVDRLMGYLINGQTPDQRRRQVVKLRDVEDRMRYLRRMISVRKGQKRKCAELSLRWSYGRCCRPG